MINRHQHQEVALENVLVIFKNMVMHLLNLNLLMLIIVECQLLLLVLLVVLVKNMIGRSLIDQIASSNFLKYLIQGRNSFPPQPLLARRSDEQLEEEGGNEEIDSQLINKSFRGIIKNSTNLAKIAILNYFIEYSNQRPICYNW
ncbi:MAG: hypothetical protein EZS28_040164 [Streblomastix strix]|uniref:Uncharacterized protein n=1 Tax=Streblomastix strix TaxID=222440 RepID=A0A5J4U1Y3_9EUKA|nr:MAG: hypothetical protein EZS28_040164 [Streblomastix strix]